ncbi:MAG: AMP phosphorylase [Candidatus Woesearchaeota archaeon]
MILKVKDMDIATGGALIAILNEEDAFKLDLFALDRIKIKKGKKEAIAIIDIAESKKAVPVGKIGLFEEVIDVLRIRPGEKVDISIADKPKSLRFIKEKLDGKRLNKDEIDLIVKDIVKNNLSEVELTFFISACYTNGLSLSETIRLTKSMALEGSQLRMDKYPVMDKHCSGGVPNNRTSMIIVPILTAAGLTIPKTSSRAITSPAGTADTMEVLANVTLSMKTMANVVKQTNGCLVWGGSMSLAAADDKMIKVRHSLSLDPEGLLLSSILAKKRSVNATHVLVDLPVGHDTKIRSVSQANKLAKKFRKIGRSLGIKIKVIHTNGHEPVGNGIGPLLEARDVLWILKGDSEAPNDLREKSVFMAALLLKMAGKKNPKRLAETILDSGLAYKKMVEIIKAQGGKEVDPNRMKLAKFHFSVRTLKNGHVKHINNNHISKIARLAGAPKAKSAGIYLYKHVGDPVEESNRIFTIYSESRQKLKNAVDFYKEFGGFEIR